MNDPGEDSPRDPTRFERLEELFHTWRLGAVAERAARENKIARAVGTGVGRNPFALGSLGRQVGNLMHKKHPRPALFTTGTAAE